MELNNSTKPIKVKELRIGNYLQDTEGNIVEVIRLHENGTIEVHSDIHQFHDFNDKDDDILFSYVELSDNIMAKFGLVKDIQYSGSVLEKIVYWHSGLQFTRIINGSRYTIKTDTFIGFEIIDHLHHLQNIIHALTGKELSINL